MKYFLFVAISISLAGCASKPPKLESYSFYPKENCEPAGNWLACKEQ